MELKSLSKDDLFTKFSTENTHKNIIKTKTQLNLIQNNNKINSQEKNSIINYI